MATLPEANDRSSNVLNPAPTTALSLGSIGRLISGFGDLKTSQYRDPVTDTESMARLCRVTFRPLPEGFDNRQVLELRQQLETELSQFGVEVVPWEQATVDFYQTGYVPCLGKPWSYKTRGVLGNINAVIDVERPRSWKTQLGVAVTEALYMAGRWIRRQQAEDSLPAIARLTLWSEDLAVRNLMDHRRTQVLTLADVDERLTSAEEPYANRVQLGLAALAHNLAHMVLGLSGSKISMINLNMADSTYEQSELRHFTRHVVVPKLFVPIVPLLQSYFEVHHHDPDQHQEIADVAEMGRQLAPTDLLPAGHRIKSVLRRRSRSDIVRLYADGRTGVSFGFIACVEKPRYVGPPEIDAAEWGELEPCQVYPPEELRRTPAGRYYVRIQDEGHDVYRQVPDIWLASSRSGSNKTDLDVSRDVIRIGYDGRFHMSLPRGTEADDLRPSFDIRVMLALALSTALHHPEWIEDGAAMFHFHGYPSRDWLEPDDLFAGAEHPTVPCGTYEAGALNFQAMARMAPQLKSPNSLACTIEPDHGTNIIARDWRHLVRRVREGVERGEIALGNKHFHSLLNYDFEDPSELCMY